MIFHDSKIIFIHIPKTGGTTIEKMLIDTPNIGPVNERFGSHHRLGQVFREWAGEDTHPEKRKDIASYHMFVVARNPWERYASMYIHDYKAFVDGVNPVEPPSIEEYMDTRVQETFFKFIEVNGSIPDNLMVLNFHDFNKEVARIWKAMGLPKPKIIHENRKEPELLELQEEICHNEYFQNAVAKMCSAEIELFGYEIPIYE